jgi:hypothetical protein
MAELKTIKNIFDEECKDLKIDHKFFKAICNLEAHFVNKKQEHIEFFGGTLTGVQVVRFTTEDRDKLFTDILEVDDRDLEERVYALRDENGQPTITQSWKISSDIFNISCIWLLHAIHTSRYLSNEDKKEAKIRVCLYLMYKYLTSILFHNFKYPADPEIAAATYAQLSYKFILKQCGSWGETLRIFAEKATALDGIHADVIADMNNDSRVINMLNDTQGRIKDTMKNIYSVFIKTHEQGIRIATSSSFIETDGELILKDKSKSLNNYTRYIKSIISDKNSFIKQELVDIIANLIHTLPPKLLIKTLEWSSDNYGHTKDKEVEVSLDIVMEHAFEFLASNRSLLRSKNDITGLISKLRGVYMSSRSTDIKLFEAREKVERIVFIATGSKNDSVVASTRTAWMLYVILRAFTMRHYTN